MPRPARRKAVTESQARQYLAKAEEFLLVAEESLAADRRIAATGNTSTAEGLPGFRNIPMVQRDPVRPRWTS